MKLLSTLISTLTLLLGLTTFAFGGIADVPEIDGNSAVAAVAMVAGGMLVIRGRRKN